MHISFYMFFIISFFVGQSTDSAPFFLSWLSILSSELLNLKWVSDKNVYLQLFSTVEASEPESFKATSGGNVKKIIYVRTMVGAVGNFFEID